MRLLAPGIADSQRVKRREAWCDQPTQPARGTSPARALIPQRQGGVSWHPNTMRTAALAISILLVMAFKWHRIKL